MLNRTRIQLMIRNAAVLSVILIALTVLIYFFMKQMLFAGVDRSLTAMSERLNPSNPAAQAIPFQRPVLFRINQMDRPIIVQIWSEDGLPLLTPVINELGNVSVMKLQPGRSVHYDSPKTVKAGNQYYRVWNVRSTRMETIIGQDLQRHFAHTYQFISNVDAEVNMLRRLLFVLLIGGSSGLIVAVIAGYYLANRALIPVRLSMEKQQQFVSDASHELRTPLSVIHAHAELLLRHPEHTIEQDSKHISTVLQETRRMSKLVSGLLTLARTDSNQAELDLRPVQLDRIIHDCAEKMRMLADVKNMIMQLDVDESIPMHADEERLHQLLMIVLDNAITYTPDGGFIRISGRKLAHTAYLEVADTGDGIPADCLPHIFDRFYRGDKARVRRQGGTGLGLAIAHWIVERHNGKIRIESKLAAGTQVFITLPL